MKFPAKALSLFQMKNKLSIKNLPYIMVAIVFLIVSVVSLFSYSQLEEQTINTYYYFALNKLEKIRIDDEAHKSAIKNLCLQTAFDDYVSELFFSNPDVLSVIKAQQSLRSYGSFVSGVSSINVYDGQKQLLYTPQFNYTTSEYEGIKLDSLTGKQPYTLTETEISSADGKHLIYSYSLEGPQYVILVDVDLDSYQSKFTDFRSENQWELLVTNEENKFIYSSMNFELGAEVPKEFKNIITPSSQYKIKRIDDIKYLYFSIYSSRTKYTYTTLIPYHSITRSVIAQRNTTYLTLVLLILAILVLLSFVSVAKIRKPISQLVKKSTLYDRYEYNARIKQAEEELKTYLTTPFPDNKLSALAYSHLESQIQNNSDSFILLSFSIDDAESLKAANSDSAYHSLKYGISNICLEIIRKLSNAVSVFDTDSTITIVVINNHELNLAQLEEPMKECIRLVKEHLTISITGALNEPCEFESLHNSYVTLLKIRNYRYLYGTNTVILPHVINKTATEIIAPGQYLQNIVTHLEKNHFEKAKETAREYIHSLKVLPVEQAHLFVMQFIILITEYLDKLKNMRFLADEIDLISTSAKLTSAETLDTVQEEILQLIQTVSEAVIIKKETSKYQKLALDAQQFIEKQFGDVNFCADSVAEHFNLSTLYLNRIFKSETGSTLAGSILKTRLSHTAKLLSETSLSIKDIAARSGFINDSYFIVVFKKHFGCTPLNYRNNSK